MVTSSMKLVTMVLKGLKTRAPPWGPHTPSAHRSAQLINVSHPLSRQKVAEHDLDPRHHLLRPAQHVAPQRLERNVCLKLATQRVLHRQPALTHQPPCRESEHRLPLGHHRVAAAPHNRHVAPHHLLLDHAKEAQKPRRDPLDLVRPPRRHDARLRLRIVVLYQPSMRVPRLLVGLGFDLDKAARSATKQVVLGCAAEARVDDHLLAIPVVQDQAGARG
mmetsp:Transcript_7885/g.15488  ORF Transcript_7885/g.15488 Transcript_7885/m.15488 type:complete len:219 (-) Transcript_7885:650-1306(-)